MNDNEMDPMFEEIEELARLCKFTNCSHTNEPECAVQLAIAEGNLAPEKFKAYFRENKEKEYISNQKNKTKAIDYMKQRKLFK